MEAPIDVIIDLPEDAPGHRATLAALDHAGADEVHVVRTADIDDDYIAALDRAVLIGPGSPYDRPDAAEAIIRSARERGLPLVGT